jgi:predicted lysophospholipase L1 biosynthesis ABC-type transport system permease subunit
MDKKHQEDIEHIRSMMERSSRFLSLSGKSGILAGIVALVAAYLSYYFLKESGGAYLGDKNLNLSSPLLTELIITGLATLIIALFFGVYFTIEKSKRNKVKVWNSLSKKLLINLLVPLAAGGIFCIALLYHDHPGLIAPAMLIFYGLALMNASKYTFNDVEYLGYCELILGLAALFLAGYGLIFWAIGFGLLHIIYGYVMQKKYH